MFTVENLDSMGIKPESPQVNKEGLLMISIHDCFVQPDDEEEK
jgi:hypothetical protein